MRFWGTSNDMEFVHWVFRPSKAFLRNLAGANKSRFSQLFLVPNYRMKGEKKNE